MQMTRILTIVEVEMYGMLGHDDRLDIDLLQADPREN